MTAGAALYAVRVSAMPADAGENIDFFIQQAQLAEQAKFETLWGTKLDPKPGLTVVEIVEAMYEKKIKGLYIMGENPAMSDPDANHARAAMAKLDHLVVQDIFLTETAYLADVVLPTSAFPEKTGTFSNSDRMVQMGRQALTPPGEARRKTASRVPHRPWNHRPSGRNRW